mgnify:CR=1 FL=1
MEDQIIDVRVLIVDDDLGVLQAAQLYLKKFIKLLDINDNPEEMIRVLQPGQYNVILLDMNFMGDLTSGEEGFYYLKKIKNPESRLYCTIAAYNTGAGNIAWAFTRRNNVSMAAYKINAMEPEQVYNHLLSNLKYDEPKHYLKRVRTRMGSYKKAYKL